MPLLIILKALPWYHVIEACNIHVVEKVVKQKKTCFGNFNNSIAYMSQLNIYGTELKFEDPLVQPQV